MKTNVLLPLIVVAGLLVSRPARADVIRDGSVNMTGSIQQAVNADPFTDAPKTPITIDSLLKVFGITNVNASDLGYFIRDSDGSVILAPKTAKAGDDVTPVAVVFTPKSNSAKLIQYTSENGVGFLKCTVLEGSLKGTAYLVIEQADGNFKVVSHIVAGGTYKEITTIIKAVVTQAY